MDDRRTTLAPIAASLVGLNGELEGQRFPLNLFQYVGLAYCSDSEIAQKTTALGTSRRHFSLEFVDGKFVVTDCQTLNGTFVNGEAITGPRAVADGDIVAAGRAEFRLEVGR